MCIVVEHSISFFLIYGVLFCLWSYGIIACTVLYFFMCVISCVIWDFLFHCVLVAFFFDELCPECCIVVCMLFLKYSQVYWVSWSISECGLFHVEAVCLTICICIFSVSQCGVFFFDYSHNVCGMSSHVCVTMYVEYFIMYVPQCMFSHSVPHTLCLGGCCFFFWL